MPRPGTKKRSRHDFLWICLFILAICVFIIARQEYKIYQVNKELEATTQRVENLKKDKAELEAEKKRLDDLKYIEKLARRARTTTWSARMRCRCSSSMKKKIRKKIQAQKQKTDELSYDCSSVFYFWVDTVLKRKVRYNVCI